METQRAGVVYIEASGQPHSLVTHAEGVLVVRAGSQSKFYDPQTAVMIGVFETVGNQYVHNQTERHCGIDVQKHRVETGYKPNSPRIGDISREQQRAEAGKVFGKVELRERFVLI